MSCPDCFTGAKLSGSPKGTTNEDGSYLARPLEAEESRRAVVLLTDAFGLGLDNPKIMADHFSDQLQCDVWVPDLFNGKPLIREGQLRLPERAGERIGFLGWMKMFLIMFGSLPNIIANRPSVVDNRIVDFITKIKSANHYEKIGTVGYCFGGAACIRLDTTNLVNAIAVCHPADFPLDLLNKLQVPVAWICAEDDFAWPAVKRKKTEEVLAQRAEKGGDYALDYEFRDYAGTTHGFAARPNTNIPEVKEAFEKSLEQIIAWFNKYL